MALAEGPTPEQSTRGPRDLGWWVIQGQAILDALHRVGDGDHPDIVFAELFANAIDERVTDDEDD